MSIFVVEFVSTVDRCLAWPGIEPSEIGGDGGEAFCVQAYKILLYRLERSKVFAELLMYFLLVQECAVVLNLPSIHRHLPKSFAR